MNVGDLCCPRRTLTPGCLCPLAKALKSHACCSIKVTSFFIVERNVMRQQPVLPFKFFFKLIHIVVLFSRQLIGEKEKGLALIIKILPQQCNFKLHC